MSDTDDKHCLFFDALGNGPRDVRLIERPIREVVEDGKIIVPRAYGLCWEVTGPLHFVEDGGFMLDAAAVDWLIAKLTAWRDAPRLAARLKPEVVAAAHGYQLLRTSAGEWGTLWQDNEDDPNDGETVWHADEAAARLDYEDSTGQRRCESCGTYRDSEERSVDEDGIYTCTDESACSAACAAKGG